LRSPPVEAAVRAASRKRISPARTFAHEAHVRAFAAETTFGPRNDYRVKIADCAGLSGFLRDLHAWRGVKRCLRISGFGSNRQPSPFDRPVRAAQRPRSALYVRRRPGVASAANQPQISRERQSVTVFAQFKKP